MEEGEEIERTHTGERPFLVGEGDAAALTKEAKLNRLKQGFRRMVTAATVPVKRNAPQLQYGHSLLQIA